METMPKKLSINELKLRLMQMNIDIDLKHHTKNFYCEQYLNAIEDPIKKQSLLQAFPDDDSEEWKLLCKKRLVETPTSNASNKVRSMKILKSNKSQANVSNEEGIVVNILQRTLKKI